MIMTNSATGEFQEEVNQTGQGLEGVVSGAHLAQWERGNDEDPLIGKREWDKVKGLDALMWTAIAAVEADDQAELTPKILGEVRHAAAMQDWKLLNETIKTKDAKHLMFTKSLMDGSINTEFVRAWQAEDRVLAAML
jgi:hypothetical protein